MIICVSVILNCELSSTLLVEEVPEGTVVVLVKGCVDEWIKERVGVAEPEEDALPCGWYVPREERGDQFG